MPGLGLLGHQLSCCCDLWQLQEGAQKCSKHFSKNEGSNKEHDERKPAAFSVFSWNITQKYPCHVENKMSFTYNMY